MSKVCKNCGKTLPKNSLKCRACGFDNGAQGIPGKKPAGAKNADAAKNAAPAPQKPVEAAPAPQKPVEAAPAPQKPAAPAPAPNMSPRERAQAIIADVGEIGIYCREYGNSPDGFRVLSEGILDISTGPDCFERIVWSDLNFGIGTSSKRPRKIEILCTYKGNRGSMAVEVDLTDMVSPYNLGVKITEDLKLHFYIGTEGNNIEYVFKFLPEEMYSD